MVDRSWMYNKKVKGSREVSDEFLNGVNEFVDFALSHATSNQIRCPCHKCANEKYQSPKTVRDHLYRKGFTPNYFRWTYHGESYIQSSPNTNSSSHFTQNFPMREEYSRLNPHQQMIFDAAGPNFVPHWAVTDDPNLEQRNDEDIPSSSAPDIDSPYVQPKSDVNDYIGLSEKFCEVLKAADEPLWDGCETETQLSAVSEMLKIKSEFNLSENCYNRICQWAGKCLPKDHTFPTDYYQTKKLVRELGLPMEKIDLCPEGCMLYWKGDAKLECCKFCNRERFKRNPGKKDVPYKQLRYLPLIPRLQRLFASPSTATDMTWHAKRKPDEEGIMCHPSDSEAWKHFDKMHPEFASEPRNVRLSLCADGFAPFGLSGKAYSCWPIIVTPYNLPPSMCLKTPYMFLTAVVPGPHNPKKLIDVCLQPLIEELKLLWTKGVPTFDISQKETFTMRAGLLWTINDFPAYGMLSGWSTAGLMACPICMEDTKSFWLEHSKKPSWFDCCRRFLPENHPLRKNKQAFVKNRVECSSAPQRLTGDEIWSRVKDLPSVVDDPFSNIEGYRVQHKWTKRSVFWELPYWKTLLIRHNLDVMHIEKNVFDNVFNTVMNIKGKSKDTLGARKDLKEYCHRPELAVEKDHSGAIPKAVYTLSKNQRAEVVNWIKTLKFPNGYASNIGRCVQLEECKLIGMKSHDCHVFMQRLIPIAFKEFLPESVWGPLTELSQFFHSLCSPTLSVTQMQELDDVVPLMLCKLEKIFPPSFFDSMEHLLIHLPFEAKIAGPIQYRWMYPFERFLHHLKKKVSNKAHVEASICSSYIIEEISKLAGQYSERQIPSKRRRVEKRGECSSKENLEQISIFNYPGQGFGKSTSRWLHDRNEKHAIETYILLNCEETTDYVKVFCDELDGPTDRDFDISFTPWFKAYVKNKHITDALINSLSVGPSASVSLWPGYVVNGYTFHTLKRGEGKSTMNSGVWVKGSYSDEQAFDFYGLLEEIIQVDYTGVPAKKVVLFKCQWVDPNNGMKVDDRYGLVEVNPKKLYRRNDPFILAQQAIQVYYAPYPGAKRDRVGWWVVCKTKARSTIEERWIDIQEAYQPEDTVRVPTVHDVPSENLRDPSGEVIIIEDESTKNFVPRQEHGEETDFDSSSDDEVFYEEEESRASND